MEKSKKKWIWITILIVALLVALMPVFKVGLYALPWMAIYAGISLSPNPPKPEITYGEFPFELVYEIDGEEVAIKDTFICEFDGYGADEGRGKYRKWKGYIKGTGEEDILVIHETTPNGSVAFYITVGSPEFYMGDGKYYYDDPFNLYEKKIEGGWISTGGGTNEELLERYNTKIIKWKFTPPITNTFK